jgi:hypothetical protein
MAKRKKLNEDEPKENPDNINNESDDTFGLPEVEYEPIKRDELRQDEVEPERVIHEERTVREETTYTTREDEPIEHNEVTEEIHEEVVEDPQEYRSAYSYMEEEKPVWPKVLAGLLALLVVGLLIWYFAFYQPKQRELDEIARREASVREDAARRKEADRIAELKRQENEQRRLDSLASIPKVGSIQTLSGRTGRYYVVVASAIDDDLLMDYANKLVKKGMNCTLIPPHGKAKFYRLAVEARDSREDAQATADEMKGGDFANKLWVARY